MKKHVTGPFLFAAFFLALAGTTAQQAPYVLPLKVFLNGRPVSPPASVTIKSGDRVTTLPVKDSQVIIPKELVPEPKFDFQAEIGEDTIAVSGIWTENLGASWTIELADKSFGDEYPHMKKWLGGSKVRNACVFIFDWRDADATGMTVRNCRTPTSKR